MDPRETFNKDKVVRLFIAAGVAHEYSTETGDYKKANKAYEVLTKIVKYLNETDQIATLSNLLNHTSTGVRMWAATFLLPYLEQEAIEVLNCIGEQQGIHSMTARITIKEWKSNNLSL